MSWFGKRKDAAEDVAIAALFTAWQIGDDEPLPMLVRLSALTPPEIKAEIACLQAFVTTLAIVHTFGGRQAVCQRMLGAFHLANGVLAGYASKAGTDQNAIRVIQAMDQQVRHGLDSFAKRYPRERKLIDDVRKHPPTSSMITTSFATYSQVIDIAGGHLDAGLNAIGAAFADRIDASRNPIADAAGAMVGMVQFRAMADSLPSYNIP
jgi:hypothetical protein